MSSVVEMPMQKNYCIQTSSWAYPASYPMGTGDFPQG